jgi:hypothetical protein
MLALPFFSRLYLVYPKFTPKFDVSAMIVDNSKSKKLMTCV